MLLASGNWIYFVAAAMAVAMIVLLRAVYGARGLPYRARGTLLTQAETRFYRALSDAVGDQLSIFAMVRIADLLVVDSAGSTSRNWHNRISNKHVDFVLCDPDSLEVLYAIELDDSSHERADRVERDEFVNKAFQTAGLPLIRVPARAKYDVDVLRAMFVQ